MGMSMLLTTMKAKHNLLHQSQGQRAQSMLGTVACHCPYSFR